MGKKLTLEFCKKESLKRGYTLHEKFYIKNTIKMNFVHNECGSKFLMDWNHFHSHKHGCPICSKRILGISQRLDLKECKDYALEKGYILKEKYYINSKVKMKFIHSTCGFEFFMNWGNFYTGYGCPKCGGNAKLTLDYCIKLAKERGYDIDETSYKNSVSRMTFIHNKCGFVFLMTWGNFSVGKGCPDCARKQSESNLAVSLKKYFKEYYNAEIEWRECVNPVTNLFLPYDIYICGNRYNLYIEVQGHQHYRFNGYYHKTREDFEYQKYKDKIKKQHAIKNGLFIEIDLRKKKSAEEWIKIIENQIN